jgi:hypothetical protein
MASSKTSLVFMFIFMILIGMVIWSIRVLSFYQNEPFTVENQASGDALGNGVHSMVANCSEGINNNNTNYDDGRGPFHHFLATFDWSKPWAGEDEWHRFFWGLFEFNIQEPLVAIDSTCSPPALLKPDEIRCEDYPTAKFTGKRGQPAKIGHAIQLGFDVDTLEVHLNELYDVLDKFFIVEWTESHNAQFNPKPLTWERVKEQPRFHKFQDKVVHLILDDLDTAAVTGDSGMWTREDYQELLRWQKIMLWNNRTSFFSPDDVIGLGDTDEIASRRNVELVKHCAMGTKSLDVGIWFPFGNIGYAFRSDFPVRGHPYTLGDPTFWTFASATEYHRLTKKRPTRMRGKSMSYLLGGLHMSHYSYLPPRIIKSLTASESINARNILWDGLAKAFNSNNLTAWEANIALPYGHPNPKVKPLSEIPAKLLEGIVYHPWFYECNRARYPRWEWKSDSRLGVL